MKLQCVSAIWGIKNLIISGSTCLVASCSVTGWIDSYYQAMATTENPPGMQFIYILRTKQGVKLVVGVSVWYLHLTKCVCLLCTF